MTIASRYDIYTAPKRDSFHWSGGNITWEEIRAWMDTPALTKACGNYVLGVLGETTDVHKTGDEPCHGTHRTKRSIQSRGVITLDVDYPAVGFIADALMLPYRALIHTTYSSTPKEPRYRILIPLDRPIAPDEYYVAAAAIMQSLGEDQFDKGSVQPERYMFKPSESKRGYFSWHEVEGPVALADELLADFDPDLSTSPLPKPHKNKRDPFALEGTVGAFNRAYEDFGTLIREYDLPYRAVTEDRWQLVGASAAAGMGMVAPGLVFSHHANDPAYGQTCSAFDLARLHMYGHLDEKSDSKTPVNRLPSTRAMQEHATTDMRVITELLGDDFVQEMGDTADAVDGDPDVNWRMGLRLDPKTGAPLDEIGNWDLLVRHDLGFRCVRYNELSLSLELSQDAPWRAVGDRPTFDAGDRAALALHIERQYHFRPGRSYLDDVLFSVALQRRYNPVKDYLSGLKWDGTSRVEECLPGVKPTPFTRLAARKSMTAAVARMFEPGCKWDHVLVLYGPEGLGKSHWMERLALGHSVTLGRVTDKDTLIAMQRAWIMASDEGASMKKGDFNSTKEFITRRTDVFRAPYERETSVHPRHCVIWATTNDPEFLRAQEGNRRFHIVHCEEKVDFDALTPDYIAQVWAEAVHLYREGELLFLTEEEDELAAESRVEFTEENPRAGLVRRYLDTLVPENYWSMSPESRQLWLLNDGDGDGMQAPGVRSINQVCSVQLWTEALGLPKSGGHDYYEGLKELREIMMSMPGWEMATREQRVNGYGPQKVFNRVITLEDLI